MKAVPFFQYTIPSQIKGPPFQLFGISILFCIVGNWRTWRKSALDNHFELLKQPNNRNVHVYYIHTITEIFYVDNAENRKKADLANRLSSTLC